MELDRRRRTLIQLGNTGLGKLSPPWLKTQRLCKPKAIRTNGMITRLGSHWQAELRTTSSTAPLQKTCSC